jgi:hypothetical protein
MNTTLRPKMSPSFPSNSSRSPKASAYAVMTHCLPVAEKCSYACADGSAMFTIKTGPL